MTTSGSPWWNANAVISAMVYQSGYVYAAGKRSSNAAVWKIDATAMTGSSYWQGESLASADSITADGTDIYVGIYNADAGDPAVVKISTSSLTTLDSVDNSSGSAISVNGVVIVGDYLYSAGGLADIAKINTSTMSIDDSTDFAATWSLATDGTYIFVATNDSPAEVFQLNSSLVTLDTWTGDAGEEYIWTMTFADGYLYAGLSTSPGNVMQIAQSTGTWYEAYTPYKDTRATIYSQGSGQVANPYVNQFRGSIVGLTPDTTYEVRVTFTDADGVNGDNPVLGSVTTRDDTINLGAGDEFHVAKTGNDANDGSLGSPWLTIGKAATMVTPGDTVYVHAGTYTEIVALSTSGTAGNYITFTNYESDVVIVDGNNADSARTNESALGVVKFYNPSTFAGTSYVQWSGINVRNAYHSLIVLHQQANYNVIEDCDLYDYGYMAPDSAINLGDRCSYNVIRNNEIHTDRNDYADNIHRATGIDLWWGAVDGSYGQARNEGNIIYGNHIYSEGVSEGMSDGIGGYANFQYTDGPYKDSDIYDNTFERTHDDAMEIEGGSINVRVWGNIVLDQQLNVFGNVVCSIGPLYEFRNTSYKDSHFHQWDGNTHKLGLPTAAELTNGPIYSFHNTFISDDSSNAGGPANSGGDYWGGFHSLNNIWLNDGLIFQIPDGATGEGNTFDYDLMYSTYAGVHFMWGDATYQTTLAQFQAASSQEANGLWAEATFVDAVNGDYTPLVDSPQVDVGVDIPNFNDANSAWPQSGSAPDMGAVEYGATVTAPSMDTLAVTNVGITNATWNGEILNLNGLGSATIRGFVYDSASHADPYDYPNYLLDGSGPFGVGTYSYPSSVLTPSTTYYIRAYAVAGGIEGFGDEVSFTTSSPTLATVTTGAASSITGNSATIGLTITNIGGSAVTSVGVQYGTTVALGSQVSTAGAYPVGSYTQGLSSLQSGTLYYYRAFATNTGGTSYGSTLSFTTSAATVTVTTGAATAISAIGANLNGTITDDGGLAVTTRGFKYGTSSGVYTVDLSEVGSFIEGAYSLTATGLSASTTYYVVAYATNPAVTDYGSEIVFTTQDMGGTGTIETSVLNLTSNPSNDSMILTWKKAANTTHTIVRYSTTDFPNSPSDGQNAYSGTGYQTELTGLTPGQTYYISTWGYLNGDYSADPTEIIMSTKAISTTQDRSGPTVPTVPGNINQAPSTTGFNLEPFTSIVGYFTNEGLGMPEEYAWETLAIFIIILLSAGVYVKIRNFFVAWAVMLVLTAICIGLHLVQGYLFPVEVVVGAGVWAVDKAIQ